MSRPGQYECRGFLVDESAAAICVCQRAEGGEVFWIPKSQIGYRRTTPIPGKWSEVVFTIPEWLIEKKQCWGLVP